MTLTVNGKNYIAQNFGISNCNAASGLSWTAVANDDTTVNESGGTASIVARLVTTSVYKRIDLTSPRTGSYTYAALKQANDNTDVVLTDAQWVAANDGTPSGEAQYCYTVTTGSISFLSSPSGADIYLDNVLQTVKTPATITGVSAGSHSYILRLSGYNDATGTVTVVAGQTATVSVTLTPVVTIGSISFASTPSGADIYLDNVLQTVKTPATITSVSAGSHSYLLRLSGYNDATGTVTVTAGQTSTVSVTLTPVVTTGSISFSSTPSGADIYLDGTLQTAKTPATITGVSAGSHSYILRLTGYNDGAGTVTVTAGQMATVSVTLVSTTGSISFTSTPSGADISIDGTFQTSKTPATITSVSAGNHSYTLRLTGYNDATGTVMVMAGQTATVSVTLTPVVTTGSITFSSTPSGADIYLDGTLQVTKTPATITSVSAGSHSYTLRLSGYSDATGTVTVVAGQTASVSVTLTSIVTGLTTNGKNYIAQNFGISNCYAASGLSWTAVANDNSTVNESGGTASIVARLVTTSVYKRVDLTSPRTGSYTYATLKQANDNTDVVLTDAQWIAANDGSPTGEAQYCYTVTTGSISFASTPSGADIYIDSVLQSTKTPTTITGVTAGSHSYTLRLTGYNDATGTVTVTAGQTSTVSVTLTPVVTTGSISFSSTPSGADIYLDGTLQTTKTPATIINISAGSYTYTLRLTGYTDATGTVTITAGQTTTVSVTLVPVVTTGSISFSSTPSGADIYIDGTLQSSKTPSTITNVSTGGHTYLLRLSGYNDNTGTVTVTAGQTSTVSVTLTPVGTTGSISFASSPSGADIYLDNVLQTVKTPTTITSVSAGSHFYILRLSGYGDATGTVNVTAGQIAIVSITLTPVTTTGSISFISVPSGAQIYLNGTLVAITPAMITSISAGSYSYILRLTGYKDATGTVSVTAGQTVNVSVTLISCVPSCGIVVL
jgi:hypothetical protein